MKSKNTNVKPLVEGQGSALAPSLYRLTAVFGAILCAVIVVFTVTLYQVIVTELRRDAAAQDQRLRRSPRGQLIVSDPEFQALRERNSRESERRLALRLAFVVAVLGSVAVAASYWLAKRSLVPVAAALEAQHRFAADASHELRTPLASMRTDLEVTLRDPKFDLSRARHALQRSLDEVTSMSMLTESLLRLARRDSGVDAPQYKRVRVDSCVDAAVAQIRPLIDTKHQRLVLPRKSNIMISVDPEQIQQAIAVLLSNASRYAESDTVITITVARRGRWQWIEVHDQGPGIAPKEFERIFERFYRGSSARTREQGGGFGLGLPLARQIARAHGGDVEVLMSSSRGTVFGLRLPVR